MMHMTRKDKYAEANAKKRERELWDDFVEREDKERWDHLTDEILQKDLLR